MNKEIILVSVIIDGTLDGINTKAYDDIKEAEEAFKATIETYNLINNKSITNEELEVALDNGYWYDKMLGIEIGITEIVYTKQS